MSKRSADGLSAGGSSFCVHHLPGLRKNPALCIKQDDGSWRVVAYFRGEDNCELFRRVLGEIADGLGIPESDEAQP